MSQAAVQLLGGGDANDVRVGELNGQDFLYIYLDLDVCIPQWMRVSCGINCTYHYYVVFMTNQYHYNNQNWILLILVYIICWSFLQLQLHELGQLCKRRISNCRTET